MNNNNKFVIPHMKCAFLYAELSRANRLKCGSLLVSPDNTRVLMVGYNGTPPGFDNECEYKDENNNLVTKSIVVHAEANVLLYCAKNGISTNNCIMYITDSPCIECAKLIVTSGVKKVYYCREYRKNEGLQLLREAGIEIERIILNNISD